jgi:UDP-GlcNAc:undecaprenyl-phosphate GlcNAc-1-phosphate transferase
MPYPHLVAVFTLSAALTFLLCQYAMPLGQMLGVIDAPSPPGSGGHKQHEAPTPAVGGVILTIVALVFNLGLLPFTAGITPDILHVRLSAFATILLAMVIGFIDDRLNVSAMARLLLATGLAGALLLMAPQYLVEHVHFPSIGFEWRTGIWAFPFTVLCLVALKNAVNMADGRNGLLLGMSLIWSIFFLFHASPAMLPGLVVVFAVLLVLLPFNWRGKLFMGDCGSYGLATLFGIFALALHNGNYGSVRTAEIILLFLIPVLDTSRLIFVRMANGHSPLAADGRHLHHLLDNALGWRRGWLVYMVLMAVPITAYQLAHGLGAHIIAFATLAYALVVFACSSPLLGGANEVGVT